jgi:uncharacterized small protein (DUF1192 family)
VSAQAYVRQVNTVYGQVPDEVFASIESELASAEQTYVERQTALEIFLASSPIDELNNRITVLQEQINREVALVQAYWEDWQKSNEHLNTAQSLLTQVEQGGEGAARSNMMALQLLKMSAFSNLLTTQQQSGPVIEVRDVPNIAQAAMVEDLASFIVALEEMRANLEQSIAESQVRLGSNATSDEGATSTEPITGLYQEIRTLRSQVVAETAQRT